MKLKPPNAHRSQIKICEKRQTRNVQFRFMPNAFRILKPIQKSSKCVWVFRNTGANAFAKNQTRLAYEDKRDLYCTCAHSMNQLGSQEHQAHYLIIVTISKQMVQIHTRVMRKGMNGSSFCYAKSLHCRLVIVIIGTQNTDVLSTTGHYSSQWSSNDLILWSMLLTPLIKVKRRFSSEMFIPIWW